MMFPVGAGSWLGGGGIGEGVDRAFESDISQ